MDNWAKSRNSVADQNTSRSLPANILEYTIQSWAELDINHIMKLLLNRRP